jgi:putative hydrolase of the HAD superfamily
VSDKVDHSISVAPDGGGRHARAVFFDVDGVLIHGYHAVLEKRRRWDTHLEQDLGIDPEAFTRVFIQGPFTSHVLLGQMSLIDALSQTLPTIGFQGSPLRVAEYWLNRDSQLNFQLLDLVHQLRRAGIGPIYIATNQEHMRAFHLWNALGLRTHFDDMFYAARLGALKPQIEFFEKIAMVIGPQEAPPLFFDDSKSVVDAATAFGWEGVLYEHLDDCRAHPWVNAVIGRRV